MSSFLCHVMRVSWAFGSGGCVFVLFLVLPVLVALVVGVGWAWFFSVLVMGWLLVVVCLFVCGCVAVGGWFVSFGEFDPGSGRTLAACLTHASRTVKPALVGG